MMIHYLPQLLCVSSMYCLGFFNNWLQLEGTQIDVRSHNQLGAHTWVNTQTQSVNIQHTSESE